MMVYRLYFVLLHFGGFHGLVLSVVSIHENNDHRETKKKNRVNVVVRRSEKSLTRYE